MIQRLVLTLVLSCAFISSLFAQTTGAPVIATLSNSATVEEGQNLSLSVSVNGQSPFTYQWRKNGADIPGATVGTLAFLPVRASDAGTYTVVVNNAVGSTTSGAILIAVNAATAPRFNFTPSDVTATQGSSVSLSISVSGTFPVTYEWRLNGTPIAGATGSSYSISSVQPSHAGNYVVVATNIAGSATSPVFRLTVSPPTAPVISSHPGSRIIELGGSLDLRVGVNGSGPFTYQWTKDGVALPGATNSSYFKSPVSATDIGAYTVTVTNAIGSVTSNPAQVTLRPANAPSSSFISSGRVVAAGTGFSFDVSASGTTPFTFQWFKDGVPIGGATSSTFSVSRSAVSDVAAYFATISNAQGSLTTNSTTLGLTLPRPVMITVHPSSTAVLPGESRALGVGVTGTSPITYQWRKDGVVIPNATSSNYTLPSNLAASDAASYTVVVGNALGTVVSEPAIVTLRPLTAPLITTHPASQLVVAGASFSLGVEFSGNSTTRFQWSKDGTVIPGATNSNYNKSTTVGADAGAYTVTVQNDAGSASSVPAIIGIVPESVPVILVHPASVALTPGGNAHLSVNVRAARPTFQWRKDGTAIPNATNSSLSVAGQPSAAGNYDVVVSTSAGIVTSREGAVTVDTVRPLIPETMGSFATFVGNDVYLNVSLATAAALQWRKDGVPIPGATGSYLSLRITDADFGSYTVLATPPGGTAVTSRPIVIERLDRDVAPRILRQPQATLRQSGNSAGFSVSAEGEAPLRYQWSKDGTAITNATNSSYNFTASATTAGEYAVTVTNRNGTALSEKARLTVNTPSAGSPPVLRTQPASVALLPGSSQSLQVSVDSPVPVTYQWHKDGTPVPGATSSSLFLSSNAAALANAPGRYHVVVGNGVVSVTSAEANVTVIENVTAPAFSTHPVAADVLPGSVVTLNSTATGSEPLSYQWRKRGAAITGATDASLRLVNVQPGDAGIYTVVAGNAAGIVSSRAAEVSVRTPAVGPPVATAQPRSVTVIPGASTVLFAGFAASPEPTYQWRKDGVAVAGATSPILNLANVSAAAAGRYTLTATNVHGSATTSEAVVTLGVPITFAALAPAQAAQAGSAFSLAPNPQSAAALSYQWRKDGVALRGATSAMLTFAALKPADAGRYTLVATNRDGSLESAAVVLTVTASPYAGVYFGTFAGLADIWALAVTPEGRGAFVGHLRSRNQAVVVHGFEIGVDGRFNANATTPYGTGLYTGTITGAISGGTVTGEVTGAGATFSGSIKPSTGGTAALAGHYRAVGVGAGLSETHVIAAPDGVVHVVAFDAASARSGRGALSGTGTFSVLDAQFIASGTLQEGDAGFEGTAQVPGTPLVTLAAAPAVDGFERLANVSTRGVAGSGARTLIAGFVVTGDAPKDVLVRGVGPALRAFGVSTSLANPRLRIFSGQTALFDNDDWSAGGSSAQISAAGARVGAFPFAAGSADAALLVRLSPGGYTAQLSSDDNATGVALIEVYDASTSSTDRPKLINLSTRGDVGTGADILIVGVVVAGNAPKKVLIRGVGPALTGFNVAGALVDPQLQLFRGSTLLHQNDNWSSGSDAAMIAEAARTVAAFPLPNGSRDAAMLLYLAPGGYTAQISGAGGATGVGLIEVYEVP